MKKLITAILPMILLAQIPFNATSFVPSEWTKSLHNGLKWTELMVNGYPGASEATETIPEGEVTTTIVLASALPEFEEVQIHIEKEFCNEEMKEEIARTMEEALQALGEVEDYRVLEIRSPHVL